MAERGVWAKAMAYLGLAGETRERHLVRRPWVAVLLVVVGVVNVVRCVVKLADHEYVGAVFAGLGGAVMLTLYVVASGRS